MRLILVLAILAVAPVLLRADEKLAPAGGGFSIEFPGRPKEGTQTTRTAVGELKPNAEATVGRETIDMKNSIEKTKEYLA